jgi:hypothetical protein
VSKKENNRFDALFGAVRNSQTAPEVDPSLDKATGDQAIETVPSTLPDRVVPLEKPPAGVENRSLAKSKNPNCQRTTLYLAKRLHRQFKAAAAAESKEMSDIMEELIPRVAARAQLNI